MKRIAIVNQRYGAEVNGGSEKYAADLAKCLSHYCRTEIITTTAMNYDTWENYYPPGVTEENGYTVRRFPVPEPRRRQLQRILGRLIRHLHIPLLSLQKLWIRAQGPYCPGLTAYLKEHSEEYDSIIFVTYLYYTTTMGIPEAADRAILVPTAHDEVPIHFRYYREMLKLPKALVYLTGEEQRFVEQLVPETKGRGEVLGAGVTICEGADPERFRKKYGVSGNYIIYTGRVDPSKGCGEMLRYFRAYRNQYGKDLKFVVVGQLMMDRPEADDVICTGFISEEDKFDAIAGARLLVLPSRYESLSFSVLEALAMGVPVLVNGRSDVLKGHVHRSDAGGAYLSEADFCRETDRIVWDDALQTEMGRAGKEYVRQNYSWERVAERFLALSDRITEK